MEFENRVDPNGKKRLDLTFFNTEYEIERDYGGSRITLWPDNNDLKKILFKKDGKEYCSLKAAPKYQNITITDPGPMGSNMYPRVKRLDINNDSFDAFKYCVDDLINTRKIAYDRYVRASWNTKPEIVDVIFHDPATIVFWSDGTKTVVKSKGEEFDPEKGLAMAISKKFLGNKGNYYNEFRKWLPEEKKEKIEIKPLCPNSVSSTIAEAVNKAMVDSKFIFAKGINQAIIDGSFNNLGSTIKNNRS